MNGSAEVAKGRIKEAAGVLTGNEKLRTRVGRIRRWAGSSSPSRRWWTR